jgi:DNA-binding response OmpR family regulator
LDGEILALTPTEWALLTLFVEQPGQVFGRETLLEKVWGNGYFGDSRTVDTHIKRLRAKLEPNPDQPNFIQTVRNFGYRFVFDERKIEADAYA